MRKKHVPLIALIGVIAFVMWQRRRRPAPAQVSGMTNGSESVPYNPSSLYRRAGY